MGFLLGKDQNVASLPRPALRVLVWVQTAIHYSPVQSRAAPAQIHVSEPVARALETNTHGMDSGLFESVMACIGNRRLRMAPPVPEVPALRGIHVMVHDRGRLEHFLT